MAVTAAETQTTVSGFVQALVEGRPDDACRLLHDEFVADEAGGLPFSGQYHGPQGFADLFAKISQNLDLTLDSAIQYLVADDTVAMRARMKFTLRASGESTEIGLVEIYTVRDAQIVELDIYYKDPSAIAALLSSQS